MLGSLQVHHNEWSEIRFQYLGMVKFDVALEVWCNSLKTMITFCRKVEVVLFKAMIFTATSLR